MGSATKSQSQPSSSSSSSSVSIGVDTQLTERALHALLKHHESSSSETNNLLGNELDIQVQFTLARIPGNASPKPIRIDIPHSLVKLPHNTNTNDDDGNDDNMDDDDNLQEVSVCLIVQDNTKPYIQQLITKFPKQLSCIKKVLGLQSLRTKHKSYTQRRALLSSYDVFMADDSILPMLTKALGSKFFEKKKQPIPVNVSREEALPFAIERALLKSTFMYLSAGTCVTVRAGNTSMSPTKLLANISSITSIVPTKVPRKWSNMRSISIKTTSSVALPIYNKTFEELELIQNELAAVKKDVANKGDDAKEEEEKSSSSKSKKRKVANTPLAKALKKQKAADEEADGDEAEEKPKKSAKKKKIAAVKEEKKIAAVKEEKKVAVAKTPKSSKKKRTESIDGDDEEKKVVTKKKKKEVKTPKSTKKDKPASATAVDDDSNAAEEEFIRSRKFSSAKKGYVFKKGMLGCGYYKDVLPVVDEAWLATVGKSRVGGRGGGRKSMGHGGGMNRKGKGGGGRSSRRSY